MRPDSEYAKFTQLCLSIKKPAILMDMSWQLKSTRLPRLTHGYMFMKGRRMMRLYIYSTFRVAG